MASSLSEFIENLNNKIEALRDEVVNSVSVFASGDDLFATVRRAGILEGLTQTRDELEKFMRGDEDEDSEPN
jgi:hypothetical protein